MSLRDYAAFFQAHWMKSAPILAFFLSLYLLVGVWPSNSLAFALLMMFPLYALHETEEYLFPGRFAEFMNERLFHADPIHGPLTPRAVFWINMAYVWGPLPLFGVLSLVDPTWGAWMPYFFIFQAVVHIVLGVLAREVYNPGLVTAWLIHVPFAVWTISLLLNAGVISHPVFNIATLIGIVVNLTLPLVNVYLRRTHRPTATA